MSEDKSTVEAAIDPLAEVKRKLTDVEKEKFFKAFLTDKPYEAEETLFQGKVTALFTSLSVEENNAVMRQMELDRRHKRAHDTDAYLILVVQYRLAASLKAFDGKPFAAEFTVNTPDDETTGSTYIARRVELMLKWPIFKVSSLTDAFNRFEKKLLALTQESFQENF